MYVRNSTEICNQDFRRHALRKEVRRVLICKLALPLTSREIWQTHICKISCIDSRFNPWEQKSGILDGKFLRINAEFNWVSFVF
jgi:hypothetical protein